MATPILEVIRYDSHEGFTPGLLLLGGFPAGYSIELPWKENQHDVSCIPAGNYLCEWGRSEKFSACEIAWVKDVPHRELIEMHYGNWATQILGCIIVGDGLILWPDKGGAKLLNSIATLSTLRKEIPGDEFLLRISWGLRTLTPIAI